MIISTTYNLGLTPGGPQPFIKVSQYDTASRQFVFKLVESSGSVTYPSGLNAEVRGTKPDGHGFSYAATYSSGQVTVTLTEQMTAIAGKVPCEIILYTGTPATTESPASSNYQQLGTGNFTLFVEEAALDKDTVQSASEIRQLVNVIDRTNEIIAAAAQSDAAKARIITLEASTQAAKNAAEAAEAQAQAAQAAAEAAQASTEQTLASAQTAIESYKNAALSDMDDDLDAKLATLQDDFDAKLAALNAVKTRAEETAASAVTTAQSANTIAAQALEAAGNAENEASETANSLERQQEAINTLELLLGGKIDGGFVENGVAYFTANDQVMFEITGIGGGGGGGGGDSGNNAVITMSNTSGWMSKTISQSDACNVSFNWSSLENEIPTGNGSLRIAVSNSMKATLEVAQGDVTVDVAPYLNSGANTVALTITDLYGNNRTIRMTVTVVVLSLSSSFDSSTPYTGAISFPYIPTGNVSKTVYFILDGQQIGTATTSVSGRQQTYTIAQQSHGGHTFRVYFEAEINGQTVRSNELYYEIICLEPLNETPIIVSSFNRTSAPQYSALNVDYTVYDPLNLTSDVRISVDGGQVSAVTVDRTPQVFSYRAAETGTVVIKIETGTQGEADYASRTFTVTITESDIDIEPETDALALYLNSTGRTNTEATRAEWTYNDIEATLTGFNWTSDGWQRDADGYTVLRVAGNARVSIPYKPFAQDFRGTGKTIEIEFATRQVMNYDSVILSCMSGGRGLSMTPQRVSLTSEQSAICMQFKEDEHVRIAFVVEKRTENRLIYAYVNGIMSGVAQYPADDDFSQLEPVNISIGSNDATTDIYCIRVYDNDLNRYQVLDNWIADTQDVGDMVSRYTRNHVYDEYGAITIENLPSDLPYMVLQAESLPTYKGDKKTISGYYVDPVIPAKSFTFVDAQFDVQGTSSQYYARKNYKAKFKNGFRLANGSTVSKYQHMDGDVPINVFTFKADVASSEGANNVELVRMYDAACPYKTPAQQDDARVRQGIDGFPMVIFWDNGDTVEFVGKYNFNADKSAEEFFGFQSGDESWEIRNNTSNRVIWKSADYTSMGVDEDGRPIPDWLNDFEARYPDTDPAYQNPAQLREFAEWIVKTDTTAATGDDLPESVTYETGEYDENGDPVTATYTTDSAEYRLMKFRNELSLYVELDSALFYYLFTELFLMVDSRAKNAFPSFMGTEVTADET